MLSGETRGRGGGALPRHLLSHKAGQHVQLVAARNLPAAELAGQLRQLVAGAAHGRTARPVWHIHIDPEMGHDHPETISAFLRHMEREFGLEDSDRCGVLHTKNGRTHAHVVYSLVRPDSRVTDLKNSYRRREKCAVLTACELGLPPPQVPKPGAVYRALVRDGDTATAEWMRRHYELGGAARVAALSPERRHVQERTEIAAADLRAVLAAAWPPSSPHAFRRDLAAAGLALAQGDKAAVIVDASGTAHARPCGRAMALPLQRPVLCPP